GRTPTPRSHTSNHSPKSPPQNSKSKHFTAPSTTITTPTSSTAVFIVSDTCYPTATDFNTNKGATRIDSAHSSQRAANNRAKKIIYENSGGCTVDIDKIIEEMKQGLYTGIGIGGKEERDGGCYARKCEVEGKILDEDSEDEGGEDMCDGDKDREGDVDM
ncbi:hypothetical protein BKA66DRAFT_392420, partial [Pyrenochaeta sp. MPI-SDFR-AT-0127]